MRLSFCITASVALSSLASPAFAGGTAAAIARVETGLRPAIDVAGEAPVRWTIAERMKALNIPGVSIAVIENNRIAWARGYGEKRAGEAVTPDTLFQAASISKPVASAVALTMVERGVLKLDAPVNDQLKSWKLPASPIASTDGVTLRRLMVHSAGINVPGFPGYAADKPIPSVPQLLDGVPPANTEAVRIVQEPGRYRYSGGGYTIMQQMVADAAGGDFRSYARDSVLRPAGMLSSDFAQPLPAALAGRAAAGHKADGSLLPGQWHGYPELAAAGLWTTPSDLARFAIAMMRAKATKGKSGMSPWVASQMIESDPTVKPSRLTTKAMGFAMRGEGPALRAEHAGANMGFRAYLIAFPNTGQGAAVMINSDNGMPMLYDVLRAVAAAYNWPDKIQTTLAAVDVDAASLAALAGRYRFGTGASDYVDVAVEDGALVARRSNGQTSRLRAQTAMSYFDPIEGVRFSFTRDDASGALKLNVDTDGRSFDAQREAAAEAAPHHSH